MQKYAMLAIGIAIGLSAGFFYYKQNCSALANPLMMGRGNALGRPTGAPTAPLPDGARATKGRTELALKITTPSANAFVFEPTTLAVEKDQPLLLNITNSGADCNFTIATQNIHEPITAGESIQIGFTASETGSLTYECSAN
jgi:hypothetical protein